MINIDLSCLFKALICYYVPPESFFYALSKSERLSNFPILWRVPFSFLPKENVYTTRKNFFSRFINSRAFQVNRFFLQKRIIVSMLLSPHPSKEKLHISSINNLLGILPNCCDKDKLILSPWDFQRMKFSDLFGK